VTSIGAKRVQFAKVAGITPSMPSPTIRRPNRPANPTTTSDRPKAIAKPTVANPGPHVNLSPAKTSQKAINAKAAAKPKG
jgi:hypothetical protein